MKRKTSTKPTRIWSFTARPLDEAPVFEALRKANRYYNTLVEIERKRHARFIEIRRLHAPELAALEDQWREVDDSIEELYRTIKRQRVEHWRETGGEKKRLLPADIKLKEEALQGAKRALSAKMKEHRAAFKILLEPAHVESRRRSTERADGGGPRIKSVANASVLAEMLAEKEWSAAWKALAQSDDEAHKAALHARSVSGLATGTYLQIEEAFARAKKDSLPRPPRFRAFRGNGKLAVQLRDVTYTDICNGTTVLSLSKRPRDEGKKGRPLHNVLLDQSVPRSDRTALHLTVKLDREPPADAAVKWGALLVRRVGQRTLYSFQLTLEHEDFAIPRWAPGTQLSEHVRIGWSRVDHGVRIAQWSDGSIVVPDNILRQHETSSHLTSVADRLFVQAKTRLRRWMRKGPHRLTGWHLILSDRSRRLFREACKAYATWAMTPELLRETWLLWKCQRLSKGYDLYAGPIEIRRWLCTVSNHFSGTIHDAIAFWSYCWARKDEHLSEYAINSERRFRNRRDAFFRMEAVRLATQFLGLTIDNYSISHLRELPAVTLPGEGPRDQPQHNATAAAPGRFREILCEIMGDRCTPCERVSDDKDVEGARKSKTKRFRSSGQTGEAKTDP